MRDVPVDESSTTSLAETPPAPPKTIWAYAPRVLISLAIAGAFVWLFHRGGLPLVPPPGALSALHVWAVPAYALFTGIAVFCRVHRWVPLLRPIAPDINPKRVVGIGLVGIAAIMFAPLRMGEAVRPYLLARDGKVKFFQALGAAGAERVVDGWVLTVCSAIAMAVSTPLSPLPDHLGDMRLPVSLIPRAIYAAALIFTGGFVALAVFYGARDFARRTTHTILSPISPKLASFVTSTLERLADGLNILGSRQHRLSFFGQTVVYWGVQFAGMWALMRGCGIPGGLPEAIVCLGVLGLGIIVPAGPGLFGAFQIGTYSGLALFFPLAILTTSGAAMVFVAYAVTLAFMAVSLVLGLWILSRNPPAPLPPA